MSEVGCETRHMRRSLPQKKRPARASRPETVKTLRPNQGQKKRGREYPTTFP
jgi:hypothetical protein